MKNNEILEPIIEDEEQNDVIPTFSTFDIWHAAFIITRTGLLPKLTKFKGTDYVKITFSLNNMVITEEDIEAFYNNALIPVDDFIHEYKKLRNKVYITKGWKEVT